MRPALFLILLTSIFIAGGLPGHAGEADDSVRAQEEYALGVDAAEAGRREMAVGHLREALKLDPTHRDAPVQWERLIRAPGRSMAKAMTEYDELLKLAPGRAWLFNNYGYMLRFNAEAHGAAEKKDIPQGLVVMLRRCVEVYEAAAALGSEDTQIVSDTGLVLEFYPAVRDDAKALVYFEQALDQTDGLYRDAFNGLVRVCERTENWETLKKRSEQLIEQIQAGKSALVPQDDGSLRELDPKDSANLGAHAEKALESATFFLSGEPGVRLVPVPDMRLATEAWPVPFEFRILEPDEKKRNKSVKLKYDTYKPIEYRATRTVQEVMQRRCVNQTTSNVLLRIERDKAEKGALRVTADGDPSLPEGFLRARMDKYGTVDAATLEAIDVPTPRIEHGVAGSLFRCILPVPDRRVKIGQTWEVDALDYIVRDIARPVPEGIVNAKAWQTLVGIEKVDGKRCAKLQTIYSVTIKSESLRLQPHHAPAKGFVHVKGVCTVLHGLDGVPRRITWNELQRLELHGARVQVGSTRSNKLNVDFIVKMEIEAGRPPRS